MEDFNQYTQKSGKGQFEHGCHDEQSENGLFGLVSEIARKFDGKNQNELLMAVYKEAKRGKERGTLTNADLDRFAAVLSPVLDDKKKSILNKIVADLKKI